MPKTLKLLLLTAALSAAISSVASAADTFCPSCLNNDYSMAPSPNPNANLGKKPDTYGNVITTKLSVGAANLFLAPLEIHKNVVNTTNQSNLALGMTGGIIKGMLHMMGRLFAGITDVVSFPLPTEPLTTPRYVWENYDTDTHYNPLLKWKPTR